MGDGKRSASEIRQQLAIPQKTWEDLTAKLRDTTSALAKRLVAEGVVHKVEGNGKRLRGYLAKD